MFKTWLSSYVHHFVLLWHRGTVDSYYNIASRVVNECHSKKAVTRPSFRDFILVPFLKLLSRLPLLDEDNDVSVPLAEKNKTHKKRFA